MSYKISKELFEAVMNFHPHLAVNVFNVIEKSIEFTLYERYTRQETRESISINDFFFMCKKWVINEGYVLSSATTPYDGVCEYYTKEGHEAEQYIGYIFAISEQQAVFDACTYILNELSNK